MWGQCDQVSMMGMVTWCEWWVGAGVTVGAEVGADVTVGAEVVMGWESTRGVALVMML